jgi:penicillin-binding protein 1A
VPPGIRLVRIDAKSGMRPAPGDGGRTVLEAFKPGTAPPENYVPVGVADEEGRVPQGFPSDAANVQGISPEAGNIMRPGTGRLY